MIKKFLHKHSSTVLSVIAVGGVVATGVLAAKATPKAIAVLEKAREEKGEELTKFEAVKTAAPAYIPAVVIGVSTIACILGANVLNKRHQAALMSAYAMLDSTYKEYRNKVIELHGEEAEEQVRHEIVTGKYKAVIPVDPEKELFFDYFSMQYFESTEKDVLIAEGRFNKNYLASGYASLNELYDTLGIPRVDYGYELGWSQEASGAFYGYSTVEFKHEKVVTDCGLEITIISMLHEPHEGYLGF